MLKRRLNILMPEGIVKKLEEIREISEAASITEVLRSAITVYAVLAEHRKNGNKPRLLIHENGKDKEYLIFM